jgi:hypothetical protein
VAEAHATKKALDHLAKQSIDGAGEFIAWLWWLLLSSLLSIFLQFALNFLGGDNIFQY